MSSNTSGSTSNSAANNGCETSFIIRPAKPEDCGAILRYIKDLAVHEREEESIVEVTEKDLIADGFGEKPFFKCLVAEEEIEGKGEVVGFALYCDSYSTWKGKALWIEDLYVRPESRGNGIGHEILKSLSKIALDTGMSRIRWLVLHWNEIAVNFYKRVDTVFEEDWTVCTLTPEGMRKLVKPES